MKFIAIALLLGAPASTTDLSVTLHHSHVRVGDVVPHLSAAVAEIDLGPAPLLGSSREIQREEVLSRVHRAGLAIDRAAVPIKTTVKLQGRQLSTDEQRHFADAAISASLPPGVKLVSVSGNRALSVPSDSVLTHVVLPAPAKRRGRQVIAVAAEMSLDDVVVAQVPLFCTVEMSEEAARPDVRRGEEVQALAGFGSVTIATAAIAMSDAEVGDLTQIQVVATGRIVRARVGANREVRVVESP